MYAIHMCGTTSSRWCIMIIVHLHAYVPTYCMATVVDANIVLMHINGGYNYFDGWSLSFTMYL